MDENAIYGIMVAIAFLYFCFVLITFRIQIEICDDTNTFSQVITRALFWPIYLIIIIIIFIFKAIFYYLPKDIWNIIRGQK